MLLHTQVGVRDADDMEVITSITNTSRMQALGERRRVLHRRPRLCIVPIH